MRPERGVRSGAGRPAGPRQTWSRRSAMPSRRTTSIRSVRSRRPGTSAGRRCRPPAARGVVAGSSVSRCRRRRRARRGGHAPRSGRRPARGTTRTSSPVATTLSRRGGRAASPPRRRRRALRAPSASTVRRPASSPSGPASPSHQLDPPGSVSFATTDVAPSLGRRRAPERLALVAGHHLERERRPVGPRRRGSGTRTASRSHAHLDATRRRRPSTTWRVTLGVRRPRPAGSGSAYGSAVGRRGVGDPPLLHRPTRPPGRPRSGCRRATTRTRGSRPISSAAANSARPHVTSGPRGRGQRRVRRPRPPAPRARRRARTRRANRRVTAEDRRERRRRSDLARSVVPGARRRSSRPPSTNDRPRQIARRRRRR